MRVSVLGAGIVGVHVAVALARRGAEVMLIEAGEPGGGTTAGSFAWIDASAPGMADYLELRVLGVRAWRRQAEALGWPDWLSLPGTIIWTSDPDGAARLEAHAARLAELGQPVERMGVAAALRCEPELIVPGAAPAVYRFPGEGWVRPAPAIAALLGRGREAGLCVRRGTEVQAVESGGVVVSCVGRWTGSLLAGAGLGVPMLEPGQPGVAGFVARTNPVGAEIGNVVLADGLMIRPEPGGRLLLHSDACDASDGEPGDKPAALLQMLRRSVRGCDRATIDDAWVCLRALPADLLPVVGWSASGLYVVATHSGITLAPALAELVASEVIDGEDRSELRRFRPDRFRNVLT